MRTRRLERPPQLQLFTNDKLNWADIDPPRPLNGKPDTYLRHWTSITSAALSIGWKPADLTAHGTLQLATALAETGTAFWSDNTITTLAKVARFAGVDPHRHPHPPDRVEFDPADAHHLWETSSIDPATVRTALASLITWHGPDIDVANLAIADVKDNRNGTITAAGRIVTDTTGLWERWQRARNAFPHNPWVFSTIWHSPTSRAGSHLSDRGFRWSFNRHATINGHPDLTWATYRATARSSLERD